MDGTPDKTRIEALYELRKLALGDGASVDALQGCQDVRQHLANELEVDLDDIDGQAARDILAWVVTQAKTRPPSNSTNKFPFKWDAPLVIGALIDPYSKVMPDREDRLEAARTAAG